MEVAAKQARPTGLQDARVIALASAGTIFEWYDFYLYGSLASFITAHFFSAVNEVTGYVFALLAFAAGFAVRPLGAIIFGRMGDLWGRKNTFLLTMTLMGLSTFAVGLLPGYDVWGVAAPVALIGMRLIQGLALGGQYGGAATYVAEHAPPGKRGFYTSWIQTTATVGLALSLAATLAVRTAVGEASFADWGWRGPFLLSAALLVVSFWVRMKLNESPAFEKMIAEGKGSKRPLSEAFGKWSNLKVVLLALFGLTAGQAVVWYTSQFYALFFLEKILKVDGALTNILVGAALLIGTPLFILFGWLSDKVGRKPIILLGCLLAALTYFPLFQQLTIAANPLLAKAAATSPVMVTADPADCSFQFDPVGKTAFNTSCDLAKSYLAKAGVPYSNASAPAGALATISVGSAKVEGIRGNGRPAAEVKAAKAKWEAGLALALKTAGYPAKADPALIDKQRVVEILLILVTFVAMVYGPIAAMLVELFPMRIRYTSMSLPYHIGNGWFGGFLPATAFAMVAATGNIYFGLWYPVIIASVTVVIGTLFLRERRKVDIDA